MKTLKLTWQQIFYFTVFVWSISNTLVVYSNLTKLNVGLVWTVHSIIEAVIPVILFVKILAIDGRIPSNFVRALVIVVLAYISKSNSELDWLFMILLFIAAADGCYMKETINWIFKAQTLCIFCVVGLYIIGVVDSTNMVREETGIIRESLGFVHPNTAGVILLQWCLLFFYKYSEKKGLKYLIPYPIMLFLVYVKANSRSSSYLIVIVFIIHLIWASVPHIKSMIKRTIIGGSKAMTYIAICFSVLAMLGYVYIESSAKTFVARFISIQSYINYYQMLPFGQKLHIGYNNPTELTHQYDLYTLDNGYVYLFLGFGFVIGILFVYYYFIRGLKLATLTKDYHMIICIAIYAVLGITETALIRFSFNFTLLYIADVLWRNSRIMIRARKDIYADS